jgi:hypothetical protein
MRTSNVIAAAAMVLGASQANAGTLNKLIDGCENGYYVYQISWVGPWSRVAHLHGTETRPFGHLELLSRLPGHIR